MSKTYNFNPPKKYFLKSIGTGLFNTFFSSCIAIIFIPLIINNLGFEEYGSWALIAIFTSLSSISNIGLAKSLVYFGSKNNKSKYLQSFNTVYSTVMIATCTVVIILLSLAALYYFLDVDIFYSVDSLSRVDKYSLLLAGICIIIISQFTNIYRSILESFYFINIVNIGFSIQTSIIYITIYFLSLITNKMTLLYISTVIVHIIILAYHYILSKKFADYKFTKVNISCIVELIRYSSGFLSLGLINSTMLPASRYLLVIVSGGTVTHAIFDISLKIALMANNILNVFSTPLYSIFSNYGKLRLNKIIRTAYFFAIIIGILYLSGCSLFILYGERILNMITESYSSDLFSTVLILLSTICLTAVAEPITKAFWGIGELWITVKIRLIAPVCYLVVLITCYHFTPLTRFSLAYGLPFVCTSLLTVFIFGLRYKKTS